MYDLAYIIKHNTLQNFLNIVSCSDFHQIKIKFQIVINVEKKVITKIKSKNITLV